ncbi:hypothetical protein LT493_21650 [Streptomyces tricolor]|nr:hypothetical protein [Streptomyces tricolor]
MTDPWVGERATLVAEDRGHVVAAAHLKRYRADDEVGADYRDAGEIDWFLWHPPASFRPGTERAADLLMSACLARLARWQVRVRRASGDLPAPAVYGLPRPWPHVRSLYERAGFRHTGVGGDPPRPHGRPARPPSRAPASPSSARWGVGTRFTRPHGHGRHRLRRDRHLPGPPRTPRPRLPALPTSATCTSNPPTGPGLGTPAAGPRRPLAEAVRSGPRPRLCRRRGHGRPGVPARRRLPRTDPHGPRLAPPTELTPAPVTTDGASRADSTGAAPAQTPPSTQREGARAATDAAHEDAPDTEARCRPRTRHENGRGRPPRGTRAGGDGDRQAGAVLDVREARTPEAGRACGPTFLGRVRSAHGARAGLWLRWWGWLAGRCGS